MAVALPVALGLNNEPGRGGAQWVQETYCRLLALVQIRQKQSELSSVENFIPIGIELFKHLFDFLFVRARKIKNVRIHRTSPVAEQWPWLTGHESLYDIHADRAFSKSSASTLFRSMLANVVPFSVCP